jgi:cyclase
MNSVSPHHSNHLRIIPKLDIKAPNLVKGVRMEGFRVIGNPVEYAEKYADDGADELFYQDIVASLYRRDNIFDLVKMTAAKVFVPLTVGGGLRTVSDVRSALRHGADRVVINTAVIESPKLIAEAASIFGSQCVIVGVEATKTGEKSWEPLVNCGRDRTGKDVAEWVSEVESLGAGEIFLTSVDSDGVRRGLDFGLLQTVRNKVSLPLVLHGGAWEIDDLARAWQGGASGVALASSLHYRKLSIRDVKASLNAQGIPVRM